MAFVDEITIKAKAGDGGDGVVRWLHERGKEYAGPEGGNGGDGGNVYVRAVNDINLLLRYRSTKEFNAGSGVPGSIRGRHGARGDDLVIDVPRGSIVTNESTHERYEVMQEGDQVLVLRGGRGGIGNKAFKSSVNRSPDTATQGVKGEYGILRIELYLIADAGLIGLPNAGKSSLLNALVGTSAKVGAYAFTTLEPNLGILGDFVLADIPGLIESASEGRGLGNKFLRHVSRTNLLLHCIAADSADPVFEYEVVRKELGQWDSGLLSKPELVLITKSDTRDNAVLQGISEVFSKKGIHTQMVSVLEDDLVKNVKDSITRILQTVV